MTLHNIPPLLFSVDDIKESIKNIKESGGKVLGEPVEIKGIGMYVSFFDTEGNRVSVMQPVMEMNSQKKVSVDFNASAG